MIFKISQGQNFESFKFKTILDASLSPSECISIFLKVKNIIIKIFFIKKIYHKNVNTLQNYFFNGLLEILYNDQDEVFKFLVAIALQFDRNRNNKKHKISSYDYFRNELFYFLLEKNGTQ